MNKAFTLIELLCSIVLIALLVAMLLTVVAIALQWSKEWAYGVQSWNENRMEAYLDDSTHEKRLLYYSTNRTMRWTFIDKSMQKR